VVENTKAMAQHAQQAHVTTVVVRRGIPQIVLVHALKMLSTQIGLQTATVTTVPMFHQIMATADLQVLQYG
jgi:hypothetical protein